MIEPNNLPPELVTFLKKENLLTKFIKNSLTCNPSSPEYPTELYIWISYAFEWDTSIQGHTYWSQINRKWQNQIDNLESKDIKN